MALQKHLGEAPGLEHLNMLGIAEALWGTTSVHTLDMRSNTAARLDLPKEDEDCGQEDAALSDGPPQGLHLAVQPLLHEIWLNEAGLWQKTPCAAYIRSFKRFVACWQMVCTGHPVLLTMYRRPGTVDCVYATHKGVHFGWTAAAS